MKVFIALGILLGFAVAMAAGMVMTLDGNPWLLVVSLGLFVGLFAGIGCREPGPGHRIGRS